MKSSQPENPTHTPVTCGCGWSRMPNPGENAAEALRYHRIQVHNDAKSAHGTY